MGYGKRLRTSGFRCQKRGGKGVIAIKFKSEVRVWRPHPIWDPAPQGTPTGDPTPPHMGPHPIWDPTLT